MLSLNPMITLGEPGNVAPYTFMEGVVICISNQIEGRVSPKWGSLHKIGAPLFVFFPMTAQILLPMFGLGLFTSRTLSVVSFPKYKESAVAGLTGSTEGWSNKVPFGIIGMEESDICGNNRFISSTPNTAFSLVYSRSLSNPARSLLIIFRNKAIFRL